jgi:competence protein ComEA
VKNKFLLITFGILCGLLAVGILFLASRPPRGSAIRLLPPPTPRLWVIQISGAVVHPGVYELPSGSRVQDAVEAAGGLTSDASMTGVNLAAPLGDGKYVVIPAITPTPVPSTSQPAAQGENPPSPSVGLININTATLEEFDRLPDIGPVMAQRIIDYRTTSGLFTTIEDIMNVPGIGTLTFEKIKSLITIGP